MMYWAYSSMGFMVDSTQANWNVICMVCGSINPNKPLESMERTCDFRWDQSLEQHTLHIYECFLNDFSGLVYERNHSKILDEGIANSW